MVFLSVGFIVDIVESTFIRVIIHRNLGFQENSRTTLLLLLSANQIKEDL